MITLQHGSDSNGVQKRFTKVLPGMERCHYKERLDMHYLFFTVMLNAEESERLNEIYKLMRGLDGLDSQTFSKKGGV